jgi:PAS domain S-box-containing protein
MDTSSSDAVFDLEYFFELSPDLLCVAGFDGYLKKINPSVSKTFGYSNEELLTTPINAFVHPDDQEITVQKCKELSKGKPIINFENRCITKTNKIIWLSWSSTPIKKDKVVFAIAKNITYKKQLEELDRISAILELINGDQKTRFKKNPKLPLPKSLVSRPIAVPEMKNEEPSYSDQLWLSSFEMIVRKYIAKFDLNLTLISEELAISERQLFRRVDRILGITPNKLVRVIRLQLAWEAIASGKYRTITEISNIAGYTSRAHFSKLFKEIYGIDVLDLL